MPSIEQSFMQIFDRKRWIERQLSLQAQSCSENLALNLASFGRKLPPWIFDGVLDGWDNNQFVSGNLFPPPTMTASLTNLSTVCNLSVLKNTGMSIFAGNEEACAEEVRGEPPGYPVDINPLAMIQRSRSRQRDLDNRLSKKAKSCNAGHDSTVSGYSGRLTRSMKTTSTEHVDTHSSLRTSKLIYDDTDSIETGPVSQVDQTLQLSDNAGDPARHPEHIKSGVTESKKSSTLMVSATGSNLQVSFTDKDTTKRYSTGSAGKGPILNACDDSSQLKMAHSAAADLPRVRSLLEAKNLNFDDINMCCLNDTHGAAYPEKIGLQSAELATGRSCCRVAKQLTKNNVIEPADIHKIIRSVKEPCAVSLAKSNHCTIDDVRETTSQMKLVPALEDEAKGSTYETFFTNFDASWLSDDAFLIEISEARSRFSGNDKLELGADTPPSQHRGKNSSVQGEGRTELSESVNAMNNSQSKWSKEVTSQIPCTDTSEIVSGSVTRITRCFNDPLEITVANDLKEKNIEDLATYANQMSEVVADHVSVLLLSETDEAGNRKATSSSPITNINIIGNDCARLGCQTLSNFSSVSSTLFGTSALDGSALPCSKKSNVVSAAIKGRTHESCGSVLHFHGQETLNTTESQSHGYLSRGSSNSQSHGIKGVSTSAKSTVGLEPNMISEIAMVSNSEVIQIGHSRAQYFLRSSSMGKDVSAESFGHCKSTDSKQLMEGVANSCEVSLSKRQKIVHSESSVSPPMRLDMILNDWNSPSGKEENLERVSLTTNSTMQTCPSNAQTDTEAHLETAYDWSGLEELHQRKKQCVREDAFCSKTSNQVVQMNMQELFGMPDFIDDLEDCDDIIPEPQGFSIGFSSIENNGCAIITESSIRMKEHASSVECSGGSTESFTPNVLLSSNEKISRVPDILYSLPTGFLEHSRSSNCHFYCDKVSSYKVSNDHKMNSIFCRMESPFDISVEGRPFSQSYPIAGIGHRQRFARPPLSPPPERFNLRKFSASSGTSSDRVGSNPEFVCYRIDEECDDVDMLSISDQADSSEGTMAPSSRKPLGDVTSMHENLQNVVNISERLSNKSDRRSLDENSYSSCQIGILPINENDHSRISKQRDDKENQPPLVDKLADKVAPESVNSISIQTKRSGKADERNRSHGIMSQGCKPKNIISNTSSFIPPVHSRKQSVAAKEKKVIRVKALEAAEAAKCFEKKKQNEREMRKAAAKLEREKLAQERHVKQKQEKEKKMEEEIAARKRQRQENKKIEKERKKTCIKKFRKLPKDEKELQKTIVSEELKRQNESVKGGGKSSSRPTTKAELVNITTNYQKAVVHDRMSTTKVNQGSQSYEMSPYRDSSDDEDIDYGSGCRENYVPSWARKEFLEEILLSIQQLNPKEIFSRKSSFDLSEVL